MGKVDVLEFSLYENLIDFLLRYADVRNAINAGLCGVIIVRPGNRKNREFYLIRYPSTDSLMKIEFI